MAEMKIQTFSLFLLLALLLPNSSFSSSSYSALVEDQTVITIHDAYPKPRNPKTFATAQKKTCWPDHGCFSIEDIFKHHGVLPQNPDNIAVKMRLNTRTSGSDIEQTHVVDWRVPETLFNSTFDPSKPTMIMIHGFLGHIDKEWLIEMMQVSLAMDDVNVVRIGWKGGAQTINYPQAVADTRVVAAEIALLVAEMQKVGANLDNFWLIGHSLGAHVMGFVGRRMPGIGRITGLDPAEPYFEGHHVDSRLDPSDAAFVDVIHTDVASILAMGFGSKEPMGHVDYYPNGGTNQPGCRKGLIDHIGAGGIWEGSKQFVVCNHERSYKLLLEAMRAKAEGRQCHFKAHPCSSYEAYLKEECQDCGDVGCTLVGPDALLTRPKTSETLVKSYFVTFGETPYCGEKFLDFSAQLETGFGKDRGQIFVKFNTTGEKNMEQELTASYKDTLEPSLLMHRLAIERTDIDVEHIQEIQVRFKHYYTLLDPSTWPVFSTPAIKLESVFLAPIDDSDHVLESQRSEFCLEGKKAFELKDKGKDDQWTTIHRC